MALEEMRGGDDSARPQLEAARKKFIGMRDEIDRQLADAVRGVRRSARDRDVLAEIRGAAEPPPVHSEPGERSARRKLSRDMTPFEIDFGDSRNASSASTSAPPTAWSRSWT